MILSLLDIIFTVLLAGIIHESSHYLTAMYYGHRLVFRRSGLRFIWDMPSDTKAHQRLIALAGFGAEILSAPIIYFLLPYYPVVAILHLIAYPFYSGDSNDFRFI